MAENGHSNGQAKVIPPQLIPWKPGQSGNPGGRAKSAVISKETRRGIEELDPETGQIRAREVFLAMYREAVKGNVQAATWLRETCEGKLAETFKGSIDSPGVGNSQGDTRSILLSKLFRPNERTTVTLTQAVVTTAPELPPVTLNGNANLPIRPTNSNGLADRAESVRQRLLKEKS